MKRARARRSAFGVRRSALLGLASTLPALLEKFPDGKAVWPQWLELILSPATQERVARTNLLKLLGPLR